MIRNRRHTKPYIFQPPRAYITYMFIPNVIHTFGHAALYKNYVYIKIIYNKSFIIKLVIINR